MKTNYSKTLSFLLSASVLTLANGPISCKPNAAKMKHHQPLSVSAVVSEIDASLKKLKVVKKPLMGMSSEGGELTAYLCDREIKKIEAILFGEMGKTVLHYYLLDSNLIFVKQIQLEYNAPIYEKGSKVASKKQMSYEIAKADSASIAADLEEIRQYKKDVVTFRELIFQNDRQ